MTNQHESIPDLMQEDTFEVVMRGYNRRQVHDYMTRTRNQVRDLEERLARAIEQAEQGRVELAEARRRMVEAPQNYEDLSPRLAQILKLGEEEAAAKRADAEAEAARLRETATTEAERLVSSARATADEILTSAQAEAERRVAEATAAAEGMLAQAGSDAEEQLTTARAEADETLRAARTEAERLVTGAEQESARLLESASAEAERTLTAARTEAESALEEANRRVAALDEHAGRRVEYLTNTHTEVVRRLSEIGSVLGDLMRNESAAGPLVLEQAKAPREPAAGDVREGRAAGRSVEMEGQAAAAPSDRPAPDDQPAGNDQPVGADQPARADQSARDDHAAPAGQAGHEARTAPVGHNPRETHAAPHAQGQAEEPGERPFDQRAFEGQEASGAPRQPTDQDDVRIIVQDDAPRPGTPNTSRVSDDTDVNLGRLSDLHQ
ncbi:hypothetical protein [Nonomuraea rhodomycinica]|uniref:DivIVA protein n=1 Tax=Nonomuraea rhodomycinica TaxID=1712872 RepID=A0A7Y6ISS4_9ACTN|nr:hypothetical protein [Nonomuraea rhodomycinica]NUW43747.1 hypothetical protein [Nonomuraea rhodomycinica]